MITPLDIENKKFHLGLIAYRRKEVDDFMKNLSTDYERLHNENIELKEKMIFLEERLKQFETLQETLQSTLVVAQKAAEDLNYTAREQAERIIKEAEGDANERKRQASLQSEQIKKIYDKVKIENLAYLGKMKGFLKNQLEVVYAYEDELKRGE